MNFISITIQKRGYTISGGDAPLVGIPISPRTSFSAIVKTGGVVLNAPIPPRSISVSGSFPSAAMQAQLNDLQAVIDVPTLKADKLKLSIDSSGSPVMKDT